MKVKKLIHSFNYAIDGILYTLKTQRNMRIHFLLGTGILLFSLFFELSRFEFLILLFTISLVIVTEMINTAIEAVIDLLTDQYHVLAKIAKNVAAGAVLVSAVNSIFVAYFLFFQRINPYAMNILHRVRQSPIHITFIGLILVVVAVICLKAYTGRGTPLQGGMPSGHAAVAFCLATAITFLTESTFIATLAVMMALLVCQSRIEGKIHNFIEVAAGACLGMLLTVLLFQLFG